MMKKLVVCLLLVTFSGCASMSQGQKLGVGGMVAGSVLVGIGGAMYHQESAEYAESIVTGRTASPPSSALWIPIIVGSVLGTVGLIALAASPPYTPPSSFAPKK